MPCQPPSFAVIVLNQPPIFVDIVTCQPVIFPSQGIIQSLISLVNVSCQPPIFPVLVPGQPQILPVLVSSKLPVSSHHTAMSGCYVPQSATLPYPGILQGKGLYEPPPPHLRPNVTEWSSKCLIQVWYANRPVVAPRDSEEDIFIIIFVHLINFMANNRIKCVTLFILLFHYYYIMNIVIRDD